jgi:hypothetical protein
MQITYNLNRRCEFSSLTTEIITREVLFGLNNRLIEREGKQNSAYGVLLIFFAIHVAYAKQICLPSQLCVLIMYICSFLYLLGTYLCSSCR